MLKIVWNPQAEKGLDAVIRDLEKQWTAKEIRNLEENLRALPERISKYPEICPSTSKYKNVHKDLVDKNNHIIYRVRPRKRIIEIINFRGTKQKPML